MSSALSSLNSSSRPAPCGVLLYGWACVSFVLVHYREPMYSLLIGRRALMTGRETLEKEYLYQCLSR